MSLDTLAGVFPRLSSLAVLRDEGRLFAVRT
jgi:hypothetical protein